METVNKSRTPSRCREWERQRRNKFNEAISKLGELVKTIIKADAAGKDVENIQYPKIEIIQKAILCLTNCVQEKAQMKADLLALQVKLDAYENKKKSVSDASTQVFCLGINRKKQSSKPVKLMMMQKSKRNALKEKSLLTTNVTVKSKSSKSSSIKCATSVSTTKLPILLPNLNKDKKGPENTIVVLPAAPYIFPQRPLLFPALPPTIVLVDQNLQPINKAPVPIVNRSSNDITKTTMVNILPISAYSRPLSANKVKKGILKSKSDATKKAAKKSKSVLKSTKDPVDKDNKTSEKSDEASTESKKAEKEEDCDKNKEPEKDQVVDKISVSNHTDKDNPSVKDVVNNHVGSTNADKTDNDAVLKTKETNGVSKEIEIPKTLDQVIATSAPTTDTNSFEKSTTITHIDSSNKFNKTTSEKEPMAEDKDKENKLPTILDSALCDTVVDTGNARLELAEEFLAASPTAAFLMSFPLVSGNRADSPAEETHNALPTNIKDSIPRRIETSQQHVAFYEKSNANEIKKIVTKPSTQSSALHKENDQHKYSEHIIQSKESGIKISIPSTLTSVSNDNPFLNLPMPSLISTTCSMTDTSFGLDFDCNISKSISNPSTNYATSGNFFYKSDPFSTVKSTIYSTSSITSGHEFNSLGLYPCAMEKYTSKNKTDYTTVEDNLMKIGSSRLTYDIDLGWSHKSFDFVGCSTASNTFSKDNILTTVSSSYSNSYPFNSEFHIPLVSSANKKDHVSSKPSSSFADTITSFYSQPANLWPDDAPFYTNSNIAKTAKQHNYLHLDHSHANVSNKSNNKHYSSKLPTEASVESGAKSNANGSTPQVNEKYTKKSPSKMHINWMTSEIRPMQNHYIPNHTILKDSQKPYGHTEVASKKQDHSENNFFPLSMHNFPSQNTLEDLQAWPSTRTVGPTEISIEPPPINLPTLVGDLALGPHDKKKQSDLSRGIPPPQADIQNCGNFLSVTQIMNRSSDNMASRYQAPNVEPSKPIQNKQNSSHYTNDSSRKNMHTRLESQAAQPCYVFNESKIDNSYEMSHYAQNKSKNNKTDKNSKAQKNNYSAEALIRGGTCTQKVQDNSSTKFMTPAQKYNNYNTAQDNSIAQVSHFPPILDYSENSYTGQQFSGTTLYNTTNTISNSFYSNFMPGSSNLMSSNYAGGPFPGDFIDYNQPSECNYTNHKYEELKIRNNATGFAQDKAPTTYKSSRRESAAKHKIDCSKKESNKKYQSKRTKVNAEIEEWNEQSHILWQNKSVSKRHSNLGSEELPFPNYVGNQMPSQYQPDFFNSHLMPANVQSVGHNVDRSLSGFPVTSRANFNLSTIFPEITMKVQ